MERFERWNTSFWKNHLYINLVCLSVCLFVCLSIFVLFYDVHKENMFTINLEDGREAPSKASYSILVYDLNPTNSYLT